MLLPYRSLPRRRVAPLAVVGVLLLAHPVLALGPAADDIIIIDNLEAGDTPTRRAAWKRAHELRATAIPALLELLESPRPEVRTAASHALDRLVRDGARPSGRPERRRRLADAIAAAVVAAKRSLAVQRKAIDLLGSIGRDESVLPLAAALARTELRNGARRSLERIPGELATTILTGVLGRLSGDFAVDVARSLGVRRDPNALDTLTAVARDTTTEDALRTACAIASCRTGRAEAALVAFDVLEALRPDEPVELTAALLELAGTLRRTNPDATDVICREVRRKSRHPTQRRAAVRINSAPADPEDLEFLVSSLGDPSDFVRELSVDLLARIDHPTIETRLRERYDRVTGPVKGGLLRVLAARQVAGVSLLIEDASRSEDLDLQADALALCADIDDPIFETRLIAAARKGSPRAREIALESLLRRADSHRKANRKTATKMYTTVLKLGKRPTQTTRALVGLAQTGSTFAAAAIESVRNRESLRGHTDIADIADTELARTIGEIDRKEAVRRLRIALRSTAPLPVLRIAAKALIDLGEDPASLPSSRGFVPSWWIVGPFPDPVSEDTRTTYFPEKRVRLHSTETEEIGGREERFRWRRLTTADLTGRLEVTPDLRHDEKVCIYAYAEITTRLRRRVILEPDSHDRIVVWINGRKVSDNSAPDPAGTDQNPGTANLDADLGAGKNRILIRLTAPGGVRSFALRIRDLTGRPLDLTHLEDPEES